MKRPGPKLEWFGDGVYVDIVCTAESHVKKQALVARFERDDDEVRWHWVTGLALSQAGDFSYGDLSVQLRDDDRLVVREVNGERHVDLRCARCSDYIPMSWPMFVKCLDYWVSRTSRRDLPLTGLRRIPALL